jgi:hypothetical protein
MGCLLENDKFTLVIPSNNFHLKSLMAKDPKSYPQRYIDI